MSDPRRETEAIATAAAQWVTMRDAGFTAEERVAFEQWRAADERHERALAHYAAAWSVLNHRGQADAILGELSVRVRRRRHYRIATSGALALMLSLVAWQWRPTVQPEEGALGRAGGVLLKPEQRVLADGTVVELKPGAEIAVAFDRALRRVSLLKGEAHFAVAKNPEWPFAVEAGGVQVRAVGTAFSVDRASAHVEVVVTEGRGAVEQPQSLPEDRRGGDDTFVAATEPIRVTADAGQRVVLRAEATMASVAAEKVPPAELAEKLAWRAPRVEFSGTPLAEAVAMMNRSTASPPGGIRLVIDPGSRGLAAEPISGVFRADNLETFVRMLQLSLGVQVERRGQQIVLKKSG